MTFRELLEKYKEGTLTEEEKKLVEDELEKNEAINDYLAENLELTSNFTDEDLTQTITAKKVRKTVNYKLLKVVALSVTIVFAILFSMKYIVSPLISSQYYNPTTKTLDEYHPNFYFDMRALTEVTLPGYKVDIASTEDLGFGNYKLSYIRTNTFNSKIESATAEIRKGEKFSDTFAALYGRSYSMWASLLGMSEKDYNYKSTLESEKKNNIKRLDDLKTFPSSSYISAFMLFNNNLTMKELDDLRYKYPEINFEWAAIKVSDESLYTPVGFCLNPNIYGGYSNESYYNKYPALTLSDYFANAKVLSSEDWLSKGYELHFTTLMKYLSERPEAVSALSYNHLKFENYLNYIDTNGINSYAVLVYANVDDLLELCDDEIIKLINIDNVLPSEYSNSKTF